MRSTPVLSTIWLALALAACQNPDVSTREAPKPKPKPTAPEPVVIEAPPEPTPEEQLRAKIDRFVPVELTADVSALPEPERKALDKLIEAARLMDPIFDRQA